MLLAGAVAYNGLLSVIPLFAVLLVFLSQFFDTDQLLSIISAELEQLVPGQANALTNEIGSFLSHWGVVGAVGIGAMLFFSSLSFRMLEDAFEIIFKTRMGEYQQDGQRRFWVSALIPYMYIAVLGLALIFLATILGIIENVSGEAMIFGIHLSLKDASGVALYASGILGQTIMLASIYKVMPVHDISWRRALIGGIAASTLWELTRRVLVWYFANLSLIGLVYGSLATVIIILITMEIAAIIVLLGAQVIAELEHSAVCNVPWYIDPDKVPKTKPASPVANDTDSVKKTIES